MALMRATRRSAGGRALAAVALVLLAAASARAQAPLPAPQQRIFDPQLFPSERPPLWNFRTLSDARKVRVGAGGMMIGG